MAVKRVQIPITFEYPDASGTLIPAPNGTPVAITDRNTLSTTIVYAGEFGTSTIASPSTDVAGNVQGWVTQGSYTLTSAANAGSTPPYPGQVIAWDAVRGDGVEAIYPNAINATHLHSMLTPFLIPTGAILDHGGGSPPTGFLLCDGASYATATYPNLFAVHGYTFGGSGANFNVPDSRGRMHIGSGTGSGLSARSVADWGGTETYALSGGELGVHGHSVYDPSHAHGVSDPGHYHYVGGNTSGQTANHFHYPATAGHFATTGYTADASYRATPGTNFYWTHHFSTGWEQQNHVHGWGGWVDLRGTSVGVYGAYTGISTYNAGSSTPHSIQQPTLAITKIIKT